MPNDRRPFVPGGTFFLTVVTAGRRRIFGDAADDAALGAAIAAAGRERPFKPPAIVLLPDPLHAMWEPPPGDPDFSTRRAVRNAIRAGT